MGFLSVLLLFLVFATSACGMFIPQRIYLIPEGVEGDIYIFTGVTRGEKVEQSGNSTKFRVPDSRLLITQFVPDDSSYMASYYYVGNDGSKTRLEVEHSSLHRTQENLTNTSPFIWSPRTGVSSWSKIPCEINYEQFYVGTRPRMLEMTQSERDRDHFRFQAFVEANADILCEGKPKSRTTTILKKSDN
jgi:hypothetical protein